MKQDILRTCIDPSGVFICALHQPSYKVVNLRQADALAVLGHDSDGNAINNQANFPRGDLAINDACRVCEIPNAFPFWGATYILYDQARKFSKDPEQFRFTTRCDEESDKPSPLLKDLLNGCLKGSNEKIYSLKDLPRSVLLSLAQTSKGIAPASRYTRESILFSRRHAGSRISPPPGRPGPGSSHPVAGQL